MSVIGDLCAEWSTLVAERDGLLQQVADQAAEIAGLEAAVAAKDSQNQQLTAQLASCNAALTAAQASVTSLQSQLAAAQATVAQRDATIASLQSQIADLEDQLANCAGFVLGVTKPTAANTGLEVPTTSVSSGASLTISAGGTQASPLIYQNVKFTRKVVVSAPWITFINCDFVGAIPSGRLVDLGSASTVGIRFERCRFRPSDPSWSCCIGGHDFTLYRCDLSGTVDCVNITGTNAANVTIEGCYMHDMYFWSGTAVGQSDNMTHNDCIQWGSLGSYNQGRIYGNTLVASIDPAISDYAPAVYSGSTLLSGYPWYGAEPSPGFYGGTSSLMFSPQSGATTISNWLVENNWISGGRLGLNMAGFSVLSPTLRVVGNRWGRNWRSGNQASTIIKASGFHFGELSGNTYEDNGVAFNSGEAAGTFP